MGVGEDVWVNSESDDGDEYFEPCLRYDKLTSFLSKKKVVCNTSSGHL